MKVTYYSLTDKGVTRDHNEDSFLNNEQYSLFMVADGMGGLEWGNVASKVLLANILSSLQILSKDSKIFSEKMFREAVSTANRTIFNLKLVDPSLKTMGSTLVCYLPGETGGFAFNVGDSRLYRYREGRVLQITEDHSVEQELPEFMRGLGDGKFSSMLSRAVGTHENVEIDVFPFDYQKNDIILLCSDGLYSMVSGEEMSKILEEKASLRVKCEKLIALANKNGGHDNITATLIQIESIDSPDKFEMKSA